MPRRLKVTDVNPHVMCTICDGYLVDATAIIECLHAFCRTCIVRYLENSKFCPVCDVQVHKTKPLVSIRSDQTLQDVVYKVVPGLYQNEMQRRREFYAEHPQAVVGSEPEERGEGEPRFFSPKESISLSLHHRPKDSKLDESSHGKDPTTRHLSCPAAFTVSHLKKFVHLKFSLPTTYAVDIFYDEQPLKDSLTLMDVAYIYSWKRAEPMKFFYSISKRSPKIVELIPAALPPPAASGMEVDSANCESAVNEGLLSPETRTVSAVNIEQMQVDAEPPEAGDRDVDISVHPPPPVLLLPPPSKEEQVGSSETGEEHVVASEATEAQVVSSEAAEAQVVSSEMAEVQAVSSETLSAATSSTDDVQPMDSAESEVVKSSNSSLPENSAVPPPMPEPTYNSVKLVSTPERDTMLSPTNGFRLKFIHDPELSPKPRSKKSGRKGGRSSRHKSVPVRLARLAPYPPPPPPPVPVTCLTTQPLQHLPQLTVGKLVPSVITTLAPTFVTTLVSTTSNTLRNVTNDSSVPQVSTFLGQPSTTVCNISTHSNGVVPSLQSSSTENGVSLSSTTTANIVAICTSPSDAISTPAPASQNSFRDTPANTKELPSTEMAPERTTVIPSCAPTSTVSVTVSSILTTGKDSPSLEAPNIPLSLSSAMELPNLALTNSSDIPPTKVHTSDSSRADCQPLKPTASSTCSKDVDGSETVSSTSADVTLPVNTVPNPSTVTDSRNNNTMEEEHPSSAPMTNGEGKDGPILNSSEPVFENADQKSESFKLSVKNSISAEFSDNDDLGCQPDLVVDEQKMDSSDNEDDTDAALRKKINAIAEKEDEADVTDDTEADSGRASDMSCSARCEEDVGSPATTETVTSSSVSIQPITVVAATSVAPSSVVDGHRHTKSNNIDHVIKQLYLQHEIGRPVSSPKPVASPNSSQTPAPPKDDMGVLDLSTCTRKPGETQSARPKSVANPVLDIKHRQQTYLPAPMKQHTACPPAPKHPTSPLLMHQLTSRHSTPSILQAQLTGNPKPSHHPLPYTSPSVPYSLPVTRTVSSPSSISVRPGQPSYSYKFPQNAAHQPAINMFSGMLPYPIMDMASYAVRSGMVSSLPLAARSSSGSHPKEVSSSSNSKMSSFSCHTKQSSTSARRLSDTFVSSAPPPGHCRVATLPSPTSAPAHPRTSPSVLTRMSPHHRSASPAPSPQNVSMANSLPVSSLTPTTSSQCKPSVPIYKKSESTSSYKGFKLKRNANLAVFNPDPNGYRQKLVIKNLDSRSNNHH